MVKRTCLECDREFWVKPSHLKRTGAKWCSKKCGYANKPKGELAANWKGHPSRKYYPEKQKEYIDGIKASIFEILGDVCKVCAFSDKRALQIDHVNGGGCRERREKPGWKKLLMSIQAHPQNFQILCANCNWIKRFENNELRRTTKVV